MVYIEDRIDSLETAVKVLQEQLDKVLTEVQSISDKKRKLDVVSQEQLDKALAKTICRDDLSRVVFEELEKAKEHDASLGKVVNEERLGKAVAGMQTAMDVKLSDIVSREQFMQSMASLQSADSQKVTAQQLSQSVQQMQHVLMSKVQEAVNSLMPLRRTVQSNQDQVQRLQQFAADTQMYHHWQDISLNDQTPFDTTKAYRLRIGDGPSYRWLYSTDVSMGQIYAACNILDQSICVSATSKSSYAARKIGADVSTTAYFGVFQLQFRQG